MFPRRCCLTSNKRAALFMRLGLRHFLLLVRSLGVMRMGIGKDLVSCYGEDVMAMGGRVQPSQNR